jgi:hypothetical protein
MLYRVPMPTKTNGVKLHTLPNNQIVVEYERGEPHVGPLAYDSSCGILSRNVTFRQPSMHPDTQRIVADAQRKLRQVHGRDDLPKGTGISRSEGKMEPRGSMNINDEDPDEDGGDAIATKLMSYLQDKLSPEQLSSVAAILSSADDPTDSDAGEPRQAGDRDRGLARRNAQRVAQDAEFGRLFPGALKILRR